MIRFAHFSDVHLTSKHLGWKVRDLFTKKATGWVNVKLLGRGSRFKHAPVVVDALLGEFRAQPFDQLVFSGDATKLAFESEFQLAAAKLGVGDAALPPVVAVPGNHDYYTRPAFRAGLFEKHFAPWLDGLRVDHHTYPFARKVGPAWLVAVNSATPNWAVWDASGTIGHAQLERLEKLCERLDAGPRILVTHYPLRTAKGNLEHPTHRLRDHAESLDAAKRCGIALWLHGHLHRGFVLPAGDAIPFPVICAGSCTQTNRWMYNQCELDGHTLRVRRRRYDPAANRFDDAEEWTLELPVKSGLAVT
ncbi:MAG: metallophosphoesterase [Gemmataceae bacterium]|nr:metallophosphoesterase [Gemmataceae bacterium]